jgi:hypothetical protein
LIPKSLRIYIKDWMICNSNYPKYPRHQTK